jgi:RNA polymerase sigma factor (sigma-70 family)
MPPVALTALISRSVRAAGRETATDADLLRRAVRDRDSEALAGLVRRYADLVWGVCRRRLRNEADAEDAFQAVFLALVRQAPRMDAGRPLAGWLHTVAGRIARKAQVRGLRRATEAITDPPGPSDIPAEVGGRELMAAVDREIARLPARFRAPVVLCCIRGLTRDEAAEALGCTVPALKSRLERGRRLLRRLLERRGIPLPAAFVAVGLGTATAGAALRERAIQSALGAAPPAVAQLAATAARLPWVVGLTVLMTVVVSAGGFGLGRSDPPKDGPPAKDVAAKSDEPARRTDRLGDPLPDAALLRLGTTRFHHPGSANHLVLSPDETTLVTLGWEGICAWDAATGKERWRPGSDLDGYLPRNFSVGEQYLAVLPDGRRAVSPLDGPGILVWDMATGKWEARRFDPPEPIGVGDCYTSIDVSPDGKTLALGGTLGVVFCGLDGKVTARVANSADARPNGNRKDRLLPFQAYSHVRFAPDGKSLRAVLSEAPNEVRLLKLDGAEIRRIELAKLHLDSAFSPDGSLLAVAERDDTVRVYETATGNRVREWPVKITRKQANENYIFAVRFSPDGKTVAAAASDNLIHLWDVPADKKVGELAGHGWYPRALAFTRDGKTLYSTGWDGEIRRWDVAARKQLPLPQGIRGSHVVAAAPDGRTVAYVGGGNAIRLVDAKTGAERAVWTVPGLSPGHMRFSPDGGRLAVGGTSGDQVTVCLLDPATGRVTRRRDWPKGNDPHASVTDLVFSADGRRLGAMMFRQGQARVWDLTADRDALVLKHKEGYGLSFSPDGKTVVTGGWDRKLRFWDSADGKLKKEFTLTPPEGADEHRSDVAVFAVAWSPDGSRIAAADLGGNLWLWDADTMKVRLVTDTKDILRENTLAFSPDGLWVATGGASRKAFLYDAWTGQPVWDRGAHAADLHTVSFGKDCRTLLTGGADGVGYLWDLRPKHVPTDSPASLWPALTGTDGPGAHRAFWGMLSQSDAAVAAIAERGKAITDKVDADRVRKWVADLDSPRFAVREAAEKEITARLGSAAPVLREQLGKNPSAEQRARIQRLLDTWDASRPGWLRAVSVLAHLETAAAKRVLTEWAAADRDGPVGRAAATALRRP